MPLTPTEALATSPAAALAFEERFAVQAIEQQIDAFLGAEWDGGQVRLEPPDLLTMRAVCAVARHYEQKGWGVTVMPLDGAMAKAADLMRAKAPCNWRILMQPRWPDAAPEPQPLRCITSPNYREG